MHDPVARPHKAHSHYSPENRGPIITRTETDTLTVIFIVTRYPMRKVPGGQVRADTNIVRE